MSLGTGCSAKRESLIRKSLIRKRNFENLSRLKSGDDPVDKVLVVFLFLAGVEGSNKHI